MPRHTHRMLARTVAPTELWMNWQMEVRIPVEITGTKSRLFDTEQEDGYTVVRFPWPLGKDGEYRLSLLVGTNITEAVLTWPKPSPTATERHADWTVSPGELRAIRKLLTSKGQLAPLLRMVRTAADRNTRR